MKRLIILVVASLAIVLMMPSRGMVSLQPNAGSQWQDETLVTQFDVPIRKSQEVIDDEIAEVQNKVKPVFVRDTRAGIRNLNALENQRENDSVLVDYLLTSLTEIYKKGIVSPIEFSNYGANAIYVTEPTDNNLQTVFMGGLYTPQIAINELIKGHENLTAEFLQSFVKVNTVYDEILSAEIRKEMLSGIAPTTGVVRRGEVIVNHGQIVDEHTMMVIRSYNEELSERLSIGSSWYVVFLMRFLIVLAILSLNYLFFTRFSVHYMADKNINLLFVLILYVFFAGLVGIVMAVGGSPYVVPLTIVTIYMLTFFNMRVAILGNLVSVLLCSLFVSAPFEFFLINIVSGLMAIFTMRHFYHRGKLLRAIGSILVSQLVVYTCLVFLRGESFASVDYYNLLWIAISALLFLGLYQFTYLLERMFGFVSDVTLLELCDTNQPLLMQLAQNAPGTFQHSVQVANLAESAAKAIGANPLLARTGALYHDIGKMENPFYFVENLSGTFNPHNDQTPQNSAKIIKSHVTDGLAIAKKHGLPDLVTCFIEKHHGDSVIFYFYDKAKKSGEEVNKSDYCYPGPKPWSREVSICMMADAIEAASRSLPSYDPGTIDTLVDNIVHTQVKEGQFENSQLTFEEVGKVKALFKKKLNNIYHTRIAYPVRK